jgi:hypothetical protein
VLECLLSTQEILGSIPTNEKKKTWTTKNKECLQFLPYLILELPSFWYSSNKPQNHLISSFFAQNRSCSILLRQCAKHSLRFIAFQKYEESGNRKKIHTCLTLKQSSSSFLLIIWKISQLSCSISNGTILFPLYYSLCQIVFNLLTFY